MDVALLTICTIVQNTEYVRDSDTTYVRKYDEYMNPFLLSGPFAILLHKI